MLKIPKNKKIQGLQIKNSTTFYLEAITFQGFFQEFPEIQVFKTVGTL